MGHGGGSTLGVAAAMRPVVNAGPSPSPLDPSGFPGFCYFLGHPAEEQRSTLGADPANAKRISQALFSLLPHSVPAENPGIPSGYTYLLQFVAHDLVESTVPFWVAAGSGIPSRNMRQTGLLLDTLYGGGPVSCPMAFEPAGDLVESRTRLRLGRVDKPEKLNQPSGVCPFRDLPRLRMRTASPADNFDNASQLFAADNRNDSGVILAQITVLFSILHNAIADRIGARMPQARIAHASVAMLKMYHAIIREDLSRRLLHAEVFKILKVRKARDENWLWEGGGIPLELSHGALRAGHAMVRPNYDFNGKNSFPIGKVVNGPRVQDGVRDPLPSEWIVAWSRFFELSGTPNLSLKLAIRQQMSLDIDGVLPSAPGDEAIGISVRDWMSAAAARMWRLDALIGGVSQHYPQMKFLGAAEIRTWLQELIGGGSGMSAARTIVRDNIDTLAKDLPLPLYILLEAQRDATIDGKHLGPLGSIILGEVLFRLLTEAEAQVAPLVPGARLALGEDDWSQIEKVSDMSALVRLAQDWGGLADCRDMPFIASPTS